MSVNISNAAPTNMHAAIELAAAGLFVFPCGPNKKPLVRWAALATRDAAKLREWWRRWPDALIGIHCGMSKITVLDGDRRDRPDAPDGVHALLTLVGSEPWAAGHPVTRTLNDGIHIYCRASDAAPLRNSASVVAPGVDVRGDGGFIIAPGSMLPDGRGWLPAPGAPSLADVVRSGSLPEVPSSILRAIEQYRHEERRSMAGGNAAAGEPGWPRQSLKEAVAELSATPTGKRNDTLNAKALAMGKLAGKGLIQRQEAHAAFIGACHVNGLIQGDGMDAFEATFASGFGTGFKRAAEATSASCRSAGDAIRDQSEPPQLLFSPVEDPTEFPMDALGQVLAPPAMAIVEIVQCPPAMAAQGVLATASLAVQGHADIEIPATRQTKPSSLFMITIGESGERKSSVDHHALRAVRIREKELHHAHAEEMKEYLKSKAAWDIQRKRLMNSRTNDEEVSKRLEQIGDEPQPPLMPMLMCGEPTFEGLAKLLAGGQPTMGVFSDEGGAFIGGHGMSADNRLRTAAGFSGLWDGTPVKRVRVLDGSSTIYGKRVSLHLLVQPAAASLLLGDPVMRDQGFLSRLLVSAPASTAGTRMQRQPSPEAYLTLEQYDARILTLLRRRLPLALKARNDLEPRTIPLAAGALPAWNDYANSVERRLGPRQPLEPVKGFGSKLAEHALRIAAVLALVEDIEAAEIPAETFARAMVLAEYYAAEALRLFGQGQADPELDRAERLRQWLLAHPYEHVSLRLLVQRGPNGLRDSKTMNAAIGVLEKHGWLRKVSTKVEVEGHRTAAAWIVVRG
ncbi:DUF3987 domain-containing protein [Camelimonas abortus]|uniref:DUF3987 domain-containing protein n=1 Tax=Camelimonas abortus TaxID=1017184 RepID=A0ABV7LDD9_9HYPH